VIRHRDGTDDTDAKISAQAKRGQIIAVCWWPTGHRITGTKKEAERVAQVWKRWYERLGWTVMRTGSAFRATKFTPDNIEVHGFDVHTYDARSRERL